MSSRDQALGELRVGDVIFGVGAGGQEKLLLVFEVGQKGFSARHVTTQMPFSFGRDGKTRVDADGGFVTIVSTARLPPEMHEVALGLDRKWAARPDYPDTVLSKAEIDLLLKYAAFFRANPLPQN